MRVDFVHDPIIYVCEARTVVLREKQCYVLLVLPTFHTRGGVAKGGVYIATENFYGILLYIQWMPQNI